MHSLSVVPIFVNAGAAVLPAIIIGTASILTNLFRPKELARICREKPLAPIGILAVLAAVGVGIFWLASGHDAKAAGQSANAVHGSMGTRDWSAFAIETLQRDPHFLDPPVVDPLAEPLVLGQDYARCGYAGGDAPEKLTLLWKHAVGRSMFLSSPLVSGERVFAATNRPSAGYPSGIVYCLDAKSGKPLWETSTYRDKPFKPFFSSPALTADGRFLLIGQGLHIDKDCALLCLDATTGSVIWSVQTPLHLESSPAIHGDIVVIGAGSIEGKDHKPIGDPGFVLGVRISDGKELWRQPVNDPEGSAAIDEEGIAYIGSGFNGNAVAALRIESADELRKKKLDRVVWKTPSPYPVTGAATLVDDLVIVGAGNGDYVNTDPSPAGVVLALERKTGTVRWQTPMPDAVLGGVSYRGGKLICPVRNGEVVALNVKDGKPIWRQRISPKAGVMAGTAFTEKLVYAVSSDGYLTVLDAADGKVIDKNIRINNDGDPGEGFSLSSPTVANGRVFVGSETGGLRCYGLRKGE